MKLTLKDVKYLRKNGYKGSYLDANKTLQKYPNGGLVNETTRINNNTNFNIGSRFSDVLPPPAVNKDPYDGLYFHPYGYATTQSNAPVGEFTQSKINSGRSVKGALQLSRDEYDKMSEEIKKKYIKSYQAWDEIRKREKSKNNGIKKTGN